MAAGIAVSPKPSSNPEALLPPPPTLSSYIGLSFAVYLTLLPHYSLSLVSSLQSRNRELQLKLVRAEEQLNHMKSRRKEDSKANARVVEIFATHRNGWQQEEKRLLQQIEDSAEEIEYLRARVEELEKSEGELRMCVDKLEREVEERDEMINFMTRGAIEEDEEEFAVRSVEDVVGAAAGFYASQVRESHGGYGRCVEGRYEEFLTNSVDFARFSEMRVSEECFMEGDGNGGETELLFGHHNGLNGDLMPSASKVWADGASDWKDVRCDSLDSSYQKKHFVGRRTSPWKVDGDSTGVPSKLKSLEQELMNLEKTDQGEFLKIPSLLRKQTKRYHTLAGKIDELCKKMQANNLAEPTLSLEFRTRHQTEFLIEAYRLQHHAVETGQKLRALQTETARNNYRNVLESHAELITRRSVDSIRNNLREIQRNLEVWLARIMGDLEGVLASDGALRVREYYMSV